ncbi:MAG TPA: ABC transporter substrate-binding protein [Terracidiphilus sp.]|nr:ABC transporter substrate-binding protein [Terracidiphilus sp.]
MKCLKPILIWAALIAVSATVAIFPQETPRRPGELVWTIGYDPKTFDPARVDDQESESVRHLTAGVLLRFNPVTQQVEPQLAESWSVSPDGKTVRFHLRRRLEFSDGASLTARDAVWSIQRILNKVTEAPTAVEFLKPEAVRVTSPDDSTVVVELPQRVIGIGRVFAEIAIEPAGRPSEARVTAGPFMVSEYRRGQFIRLARNPHYFKHNAAGKPLPYASGVRLDIVNNPEQEVRGLLRGEYDLIEGIAPDYFELLRQRDARLVRDLGPSLNTEQLWFNQSPDSPLPAWEKKWFQTQGFRVALSLAIDRADLARIAYSGHATPAYDFISPANTAWYNRAIRVPAVDLKQARARLAAAGFHLAGDRLLDAEGHPVSFSILTNAGNAARARMAALIQQDWKALGIEVTVVALDFPALIDRLMHSQNYEACLLGLENVDPEPNQMANIWLSSSPNHQWNPSEKSPATPWEAEIDREMTLQASAPSMSVRKKAVDRVQQIVADQQPFLYLVYPNTLDAISTRLEGVQPSVIQPGLTWNAEVLHLGGSR